MKFTLALLSSVAFASSQNVTVTAKDSEQPQAIILPKQYPIFSIQDFLGGNFKP
jgi:hypothetical protein